MERPHLLGRMAVHLRCAARNCLVRTCRRPGSCQPDPQELGPARAEGSVNLGLDYLFLILYSTTLAFACIWAAGQLPPGPWVNAGVWLAWGQWTAALFDA